MAQSDLQRTSFHGYSSRSRCLDNHFPGHWIVWFVLVTLFALLEVYLIYLQSFMEAHQWGIAGGWTTKLKTTSGTLFMQRVRRWRRTGWMPFEEKEKEWKKMKKKVHSCMHNYAIEVLYHILGFYVSLKMKRAAVSLCANDVDSRKRAKSVKKHGESKQWEGTNKTLTLFPNFSVF